MGTLSEASNKGIDWSSSSEDEEERISMVASRSSLCSCRASGTYLVEVGFALDENMARNVRGRTRRKKTRALSEGEAGAGESANPS